jgi:hypothetical protein
MGRGYVTITAASYAALIAQAKAIADEFITINAASGAAIADADKVNMPEVVMGCALGVLAGRQPTGGVATAVDVVQMASIIYATAASAKANGGLT